MPHPPRLLLVVTLTGLACGGPQPAVPGPASGPPAAEEVSAEPAQALSAEQLFAELEERLLTTTALRFEAALSAEGAVEASLSGTAIIARDQRAALSFEGSFDGQPASPWLTSDGSLQSGGQPDEAFAEARAPALQEGLVIGLTRMGLLHNLAMLVGGEPPDRTDGTVRQWVTVSDLSLGEPEQLGDVRALPLSFRIVVAGEPQAEATLWLDAATHLPLQRRQVVRFDEGEMSVTERYRRFEVDVDLAGQAFDVGAPGCPAARP